MISICICICTRNRQKELKKLLDSLIEMQIPPDTNVRIIVVENDLESYSEEIVKEYLLKSKLRISYFLETSQGIAFARNRSVREANGSDFCCFVDDDQFVSPDWLIELLKCQTEFNADGVWGSNPPIFNKNVPLYVKQFHKPYIYEYGTIVKMAATNCLLLRKKYLDMIDGPFDVRFNFTGGEDIYLTFLVTNKGGVIRFNPNAIAYENIPNARATIKYLIKRAFRNSNASYFVESLKSPNFNKRKVLKKEGMRFFYGILIIIPYLLFAKSNRLKGLLTIIESIGGLYFILGKQFRFYN